MLKSLHIKNFALIDNLIIEFNKGLNILLGETGAGKSLIIESLNLLNGEKFRTEFFRDPTKKAVVEAVFINISDEIKEILHQNQIDTFDELILRREVLPSGYSRSFINDTPATISILKEIFPLIVDIHSQHKNILLANRNFLFFSLDSFAHLNDKRKDFSKNYVKYRNLQEKLKLLKDQQVEFNKKHDYLIYQLNELRKLNYSLDEFVQIEARLNEYENAQEIITTLSEIEETLSIKENSIISEIKNIERKLNNLKKIISIAENWISTLNNIYFQLKEICYEINNKKNSVQISHDEYKKLKAEVDFVYSLYQKHHLNNYIQLLELKAQVEKELSTISNFSDEIKNLEYEIENIYYQLKDKSEELSLKRSEKLDEFQRLILLHLNDLNLKKARFKVDLSTSEEFNLYGKNNIKFLFSANPDFPMQSIEDIASGGELSRFMLALKTVIAEELNTATIVFDEIDTGISGDTAYKVGKKIKEIAKNTQIIVITHTPQVAACGDVFFLVQKTVQNNNTQISIMPLDEELTKIEIARLLSSNKITETAIKHAEELLKQNK